MNALEAENLLISNVKDLVEKADAFARAEPPGPGDLHLLTVKAVETFGSTILYIKALWRE